MSTVTVFDPNNVCTVINSAPPVDQTALVASLQSQVTSLTTQVAGLNGQLATVTAARDAALAKIAAAQAALA